MTLFHVIAIVLYVVIVISASKLLGLDPILAGGIGIAIIIPVWIGIDIVRRRKVYPECHNPKCKARAYRATGLAKDSGIGDSGLLFKCSKCGEKYLHTRTHFMILGKNNDQIKHMRRESPAHRWEIDT